MGITSSSDVVASSKKPDLLCPQLPGTLIRIFIPPGAVINLLNIVEITSPSGICLIVRLPFLEKDKKHGWYSVLESIKEAGGTVEFVKE